jgi:hypothetical protein
MSVQVCDMIYGLNTTFTDLFNNLMQTTATTTTTNNSTADDNDGVDFLKQAVELKRTLPNNVRLVNFLVDTDSSYYVTSSFVKLIVYD